MSASPKRVSCTSTGSTAAGNIGSAASGSLSCGARLLLWAALVVGACALPAAAEERGAACFPSPVSGASFGFDLGADLPDEPITAGCSPWVCQQPETGAPTYVVTPAGCNGNVQTCTVQIRVPVTVPGNHQFPLAQDHARVLWFAKGTPDPLCYCPALPCAAINECGNPALGGAITTDTGEAWVRMPGLTCANLLTKPGLKTYSLSVYTCRANEDVCDATSCQKVEDARDLVLNPLAAGQAIGCLAPPTSGCPGDNSCTMCRQSGEGGASAAGGGGGASPSGSGPGEGLSHLAGGVGGPGFPGTGTRSGSGLGRFWMAEWAERIVQDPDDTHVWLATRHSTFREFKSLSGGVYQVAAPSDEYRTLRRTAGGWGLEDLSGGVQSFGTDGLWTQTADKNGNTTAAVYVAGVLASVSFPDERGLTFTYHPSGKLASITEVGVDGNTTRTWAYTWTGEDLTRIDRPDGTAWEMVYGDASWPGYLTLLKLRGTGAEERIAAGWQYDARGNVAELWRGAATATDPAAVDHWQFAFNDPVIPTVTTVTDPLGDEATLTLTRDTRSRKPKLLSTTGDCPGCGLSPNTELFYESSTHPLRVTRQLEAEGNETTFTYDAQGQMLTRVEVMARNSQGTPTQTRTTTWEYDVNFPVFPTLIRRPSTSGTGFRETQMAYGVSNGNLLTRTETGKEVTRPGGTFSLVTQFASYNPAGQVLTSDPPGYGTADQTTFTYDAARGNLVPATRSDPLVGTTFFGHDAFNRRTSVTDPNGVATETSYDALDRVLQVRQIGDASTGGDLVTTYQYTPFGDLSRTILPKGNLSEHGYDAAGRLISIERKPGAPTAGERTRYTLDDAGNRTKEELQRWNGVAWETVSFTDFQFISRCQLGKLLHADGSATEHAYDCNGNLKRVWDANHPSAGQSNPATQTYAYDLLDRLTSVTEPWSGTGGPSAVTKYEYDLQDHLSRVTDAEGNATTYIYSDRDLMTSEVSVVPGTATHSYNDHGELESTTDSRPVTMTRTIDALDRVTFVDYPGTVLDITYTYDDPLVLFSKGRLTRLSRGGSVLDYRYDRFGRVLQDGALQHTYDANGNRLTVLYPGAVTASFTHDFADREASLTIQRPSLPDQILVSGTSYKPFGPLASLTFGNTLTETRDFTSRYLPDRIRLAVTAGGTLRLDWDYATDFIGNPTAIADLLNAANHRTFGYRDVQYFLTQGDGPWGTRAWTHDKIGNRKTEMRPGVTDTYTYTTNATGGNTPKLSQVTLGALGTRSYTYGPAGHVGQVSTTGNTVTFTTSDASRTSRVERTAGSFTNFTYDGRDFLFNAQGEIPPALHPSPAAKGTPGTPIFSDGFEDGTVCAWSTFLGIVTPPPSCPKPTILAVTPTYSSGGRLHRLTRDNPAGPEEIFYFYFAGRPVAQMEREGSTDTFKWITTDHLGTPVAATSSTGGLLWQGGFEPFGADWSNAAASNIELRLPGQWLDEAWKASSLGAEVYYNAHRWYENQTGRYTRPDPAAMVWGLAPMPFRYAEARPSFYKDPAGLWSVQPSCLHKSQQGVPDEQTMDPAAVQAGIEFACLKGTTPGTKCYEALLAVGEEADIDFPKCFARTCRAGSGPTLACNPCNTNCGTTIIGFTELGAGRNEGCPFGNGLGYGPTIFHETLHHCGFAGEPIITEPGPPSRRAGRWRYLEWTCFGWRHPLSPPRRR